MNKIGRKSILTKIDNFIYKMDQHMERNKFLVSIKNSFVFTIPIFMIGAFALLLQNFPIPVVQTFFKGFLDGTIYSILQFIYNATYGIASIHVLIVFTYIYSHNFLSKKHSVNILICMMSLANYFILLGVEDSSATLSLSYDMFNMKNIFLALICSYLSIRLYILFSKIPYKKKTMNTEIDFQTSISFMFPMVLTLFSFCVITVVCKKVFHVDNVSSLVLTAFALPFKNMTRSLGTSMLIILLEGIFWFFGMHGSNIFESTMLSIFGEEAGVYFTKSFIDTFVILGGCGTSICLLLALVIRSKRKENLAIVKKSFIPMVFNINEILVFGLPIVINPIYLIPFLLTPQICLINSYLAVELGLVRIVNSSVLWTTPVLLSGYLSSGSINGMLLQLFNIVVGILIYLPFVILSERIQRRKVQEAISTMIEKTKNEEKAGKSIAFLNKNDYLSKVTTMITNELIQEINQNTINLFYQPIADKDGKISSTESLLRFKLDNTDYIYPPLIINIAKEAKLFNELTKTIILKVMDKIKEIESCGIKDLTASTNIQVSQLLNKEFITWVIETKKEKNIPDDRLILEVTEESVLAQGEDISQRMSLLRKEGILLAIDDFGVGHTSISYLQNANMQYLKIDGSLIRRLSEERIKQIVSSVVELGKKFNFKVIAECVETQEQVAFLCELNCDLFQGYYFYRPLSELEYSKRVLKEE